MLKKIDLDGTDDTAARMRNSNKKKRKNYPKPGRRGSLPRRGGRSVKAT